MKIVQILPELNEGGVERGTVELSRELVKKGYESVVISHGGKQVSQLENEGALHVKLDVCSKNILTAPWRIIQLYRILKDLKPDIIHVRSRVPAWMVFFANKLLKLPLVTTSHGLYSINAYSAIMTKGDRVICVSETVKEYLLKHFKIDNPEKFIPIDRGVDMQVFTPENTDKVFIEDFKQRYNLEGKYIVTTIGRIVQGKDYETFIKGIALAKKEIPNIVGLIVGGVRENKIDYAKSLETLVNECGCTDEIIFTGNQTKIPEICYMSDIVVSTTPMMGNVARTLIEALALGTPVIMTSYEGLKNIVTNGLNGYLIKTGDAQDLADKLILSNKKDFDNIRETLPSSFTLDYMVNENIKIYKSLCERASC